MVPWGTLSSGPSYSVRLRRIRVCLLEELLHYPNVPDQTFFQVLLPSLGLSVNVRRVACTQKLFSKPCMEVRQFAEGRMRPQLAHGAGLPR